MAVDSNTGSFDTHSVKVLVRSHYPFEMARPPLFEEGHLELIEMADFQQSNIILKPKSWKCLNFRDF